MDRDVKASGQDDRQAGFHWSPGLHPGWRSREVERQLALEASGVMDAARDPRYGRAANLKKTLGICLVALAAVGAMVTTGLLLQDGVENVPLTVVSSVDPGEPSAESAAGAVDSLALAALEAKSAGSTEPAVISEPNRADCGSIRGTSYLSESERMWFLASCGVEAEPVFLAAPGSGGVVTEPAATGTTATGGITEGEAIDSGASWMTIQPDGAYDVATAGCNASQLGGVWLVTCEATLTGCMFEMCTSWQAVCVVETDGAIIPTKDC